MPPENRSYFENAVPLGDCGVITRRHYPKEGMYSRKIDVDNLAGSWNWVKKPNLIDEFRPRIFAVRVRR